MRLSQRRRIYGECGLEWDDRVRKRWPLGCFVNSVRGAGDEPFASLRNVGAAGALK